MPQNEESFYSLCQYLVMSLNLLLKQIRKIRWGLGSISGNLPEIPQSAQNQRPLFGLH